jgi:hypothetical protein
MKAPAAEGSSVTLYADLQSATPLQGANETRPQAPSTGKPASRPGTEWQFVWTSPAQRMYSDWKPGVLRIIRNLAPERVAIVNYGWQPRIIDLIETARPLTSVRIVGDEQTEHSDWMDYEYPWSFKDATGFYAGEMEWPEVDTEY